MFKSLLRTETITYDGGTITVQSASILSLMDRGDILNRLREEVTRGADYLNGFADVLSQTTVFEGFDFTLPSAAASVEELRTAFDWYIRLPADLIRLWIAAVSRANEIPGTDPDLQPSEVQSKDPKSVTSGRRRSNG